MKENQFEQLHVVLNKFLQQLHIDDAAMREQLCDNVLKRFEPFLAEISYDKSVKIVCNQMQKIFNHALAKYLNITDHDELTAARAKLLSKKQSTDFLFKENASSTIAADTLVNLSTTPAAAPLAMPAQTLKFIFSKANTQGQSS